MAGLDFDCNELNNLVAVANASIGEWLQDIENICTKLHTLNMTDTIEGQTADSIKAYINEVHLSSLIPTIKTMLGTYQANLALYEYRYAQIDSDIHKHLNEETMTNAMQYYDSDMVSGFSDYMSGLLSSVSELITIDNPSVSSILQAQSRIKYRISNTLSKACELESSTKYIEIYNIQTLTESISRAVLSMSARSSNEVTQYTPGQIKLNEIVANACQLSQCAIQQMEQNKSELDDAFNNEKELFQKLQKEVEEHKEAVKDEGRAEVIGGVVTFTAGVIAIIATWEVSIPVCAVGIISGTGTCLFSASNICEGAQMWYTGDENAVNPIRDYIFRGKEELYQLWGNANVFVASMVTPIGMTAKAGQAFTYGMGIKMAAQYTTGAVTSYGVSYFGEKLGLSKTGVTMLNLGVGYLEGCAWNKGEMYLRSRKSNSHVDVNTEEESSKVLGNEGGKYSELGEMGEADGTKYSNWMKVREGELQTDYVKLGQELSNKLDTDGYNIIKVEDASVANADWYEMGYDKPPVAEGTNAITVEAGKFKYARVFNSSSRSKAKSPFILRYDDIKGLTKEQIAEKYALPQIPDSIVFPHIPESTPLEVSIVGPQTDWGTIGGDPQYAIKDVLLDDNWFTDIHPLE